MGSIGAEDGCDSYLNSEDFAPFASFQAPTVTIQSDRVEEILLLGWLLVLYRLSDGNDVQCTAIAQKTTVDDKRSQRATVLGTSHISLKPSISVSTALEAVRSRILKEGSKQSSASAHANDTLFWLYDVAVPNEDIERDGFSEDDIQNWNVMLEIRVGYNHLWLRPSWRSPTGTEYMAQRHVQAFIDILQTVLVNEHNLIGKAFEVTEMEKMQIWEWNRDLPPLVSRCMQDLIAKRARSQPSATAICAWDGELSYQEVDDYSTLLACHLVAIGLRVGDIVPVCIEKSRWTVVAVLAVMKAGGGIALMDPSQPLARRQIIAEQVNAKYIVVSKKQGPSGSAIVPGAQVVTVSQDFLDTLAIGLDSLVSGFPLVPTDSILYIIFTSGSTGKPKGVVISHETYTSSAIPRSRAVGYDTKSRVLDFASYAFDVSIDSMLCTLLQGGCLCIPSDEDRVNDLSDVIRRMKINMANLTPSVARVLDADIIPSLSSLGLGGESVSTGDLDKWGASTRIVIGYGPSECTVGCTINSRAEGKPYVSIGPGNGAVIWVVDPENHDRLMPIGAVGELLVEGPIVGQGYLNDPEKTAAAFINDPAFLVDGAIGYPGRHGRLYKTGDLVRYDPDGLKGFVFVGRKDTQVKLRGQRVELGEIEHNIRAHLPIGYQVAAEVIAPNGQTKESMLVAFIAEQTVEKPQESEVYSNEDILRTEFSSEAEIAIAEMNEQLSGVLPIYMIPSAYIGLNRIPMLVSGKQDRKFLRSLGATTPLKDFAQPTTSRTPSFELSSREETCLRKIWSRLLEVPESQVGASHNFFSLGGESIIAMKLVAAVREDGFQLTVADVLSRPRLSAMAQAMQAVNVNLVPDVPAFSLLDASRNREDACVPEAARLCTVNSQSIEDIYPCTALQEILITFSARSAEEGRFAQRVVEVGGPEQVDRLKAAWEQVFTDCPILRTRVVDFQGRGFMQVVIQENIKWNLGNDLKEFLEVDKKQPMTLGTPLVRFSIVTDRESGKFHFVWTIHHALYDGWSTDLILERVRDAYRGLSKSRPATIKHYVRYLTDSAREASRDYWKIQLQGATGPQYPSLPSRSYLSTPDAFQERYIPLKRNNNSSITVGTLIRAAWALLASQYTMVDDVVFGETLTGRQLPIPGIEEIEGPTIVTMPVRVRIDRSAPVQEFLQGIQEQGFARISHEHLGMQHIRQVSADAQIACELKTGLIIQPAQNEDSVDDDSHDAFPSFPSADAAREALHFNSYPLMLAFSLQREGVTVMTSFDSNLVTERQMQRLLAQLESTVQQLAREEDIQVGSMNCFGEHDLQDLLGWTPESPESPGHTQVDIHQFLNSLKTLQLGDALPRFRGSWIVSATNHEQLMPIGTIGELVIENIPSSVKSVEDPESLVQRFAEIAGRPGTLHKSGKLVKYDDHGSMIFLGSKETRFNLHGQVFDLATIETTLRRILPSTSRIYVTLIEPTGSYDKVLTVLINEAQEQIRDDSRLRDFQAEVTESPLKLSRAISEVLADVLIGLDRLLSDVLPPHMIPSCYIPLSEFPKGDGEIDTDALIELSRHITPQIILRSRTALANLRAGKLSEISLNAKEYKLREMWAKILGLDELAISLDDSFFQLGGDSIMAMKLISMTRRAGFNLSVADVFRHMRLADMASMLHENDLHSNDKADSPKPFSLLNVTDVGAFLSTKITPVLADPRWKIQDVLPTTDPQSRDIHATITAPRSAVQYNMFYINKSVDKNRLIGCCQQLVSRHEILRTVFVEVSDSCLQVVVEQLDIPITQHEADGDLAEFCQELSASDIEDEMEFSFGRPFLKFIFIQGVEENCLMIRISHAQYDGISFPELIRQLEALYVGQAIAPSTPFSSYVGQLAKGKDDSIQYWRRTLQGSALTILHRHSVEPQSARTLFLKKTVDISARSKEVTVATMLTAAWTLVLSRYLSISDVVFGTVAAGRTVDLPEVESIMGPCYQFCPMRVKLDSTWLVRDLLEFIRNQYAESTPFEHLGFADISRQCTSWSPNVSFFDSIVHHQDIEYFDTIPFADTTCRVSFTNPHPEPSQPIRVVSFPENGQLGVGIVVSESLEEFGRQRLDELCDLFIQFVEHPEAKIY